MSLLCQLFSLYESIQEYKGACQAVSNADCTYALENGFFDEEEDNLRTKAPVLYVFNTLCFFKASSLSLALLCSSSVQRIRGFLGCRLCLTTVAAYFGIR
uniref:Protein FAM89A n=1 Tax=Crocodylus porosus TaxID=8502 RepID=A0A7M4FH96_CROPO